MSTTGRASAPPASLRSFARLSERLYWRKSFWLGLDEFRQWVYECKIFCYTDHKPIVYCVPKTFPDALPVNQPKVSNHWSNTSYTSNKATASKIDFSALMTLWLWPFIRKAYDHDRGSYHLCRGLVSLAWFDIELENHRLRGSAALL